MGKSESYRCMEGKHNDCSFLESFLCNCPCHKQGLADFFVQKKKKIS